MNPPIAELHRRLYPLLADKIRVVALGGCGGMGQFAARTKKVVLVMILLVGFAAFPSAHPKAATKPNIVVMMVDNLGWGELGCYGGGELRGAATP